MNIITLYGQIDDNLTLNFLEGSDVCSFKARKSQVNSSIEHINALIDSRVFQQARDQYMACMDLEKIEEKGLEPLLSLLKKFGGWPVLEDNWNEANFKWYLFAIVIFLKECSIKSAEAHVFNYLLLTYLPFI